MSTKQNNIQSMIERFHRITKEYEDYKDILGNDHFYNIQMFAANFKKDASAIMEENRKLKIGVVGQMKAGKSSFLNAILFDGKDVLPKAATPMTAALTVISYGEKPAAEIEFYTEEEWAKIIEKADAYETLLNKKCVELEKGKFAKMKKVVKSSKQLTFEQLRKRVKAPSDLEAAYDLIDMERNSSKPITKYLGQTKTIDDVEKVDQLIGKLQDYVGAEGSYTPIVKNSKLYIPNEAIKDMDVVDTPGVNDPIISRGQRTREYLGKCDVVFLLSYSGQFMDTTDVELVTQNIPDKGIQNIVLLGSLFDLVLLDDGDKYDSLRQALKEITIKLNDQASSTVLPIVRRHKDNELLQSLKSSLPPIFISSFAYNMGKRFEQMNLDEKHVYKRLKETFPQDELEPELLRELSNIDVVKDDEFAKVRNNKEQIMSERFDNLLQAQEQAFVKELLALKQELENDLEKIQESSKEELEAQFKAMKQHMESASKKVDLVFDKQLTKMQKEFSHLKTYFKQIARDYKRFDETTERRRVKTGTERYGFLWLKKRDVYETKTFNYANVHQTIDKVEDLVVKVEEELKKDFDEIIDTQDLNKKLKDAILGIYDLSDESFDFEDLVIPVQKTVNRISLPTFELNGEKYSQKLSDQFGFGQVEGNDIKELKSMQHQMIDAILQDVAMVMEEKIDEIETSFNEVSNVFIDDVLRESRQKTKTLTKQLEDRQTSQKNYANILSKISEDIKRF